MDGLFTWCVYLYTAVVFHKLSLAAILCISLKDDYIGEMKLITYLLGILLLSSCSLNAQNMINTDRPDQSDGTHIVEKQYFQIESGVQFSKSNETSNSFDNITLIRYGITKKFEARLLNQYSVVCHSPFFGTKNYFSS